MPRQRRSRFTVHFLDGRDPSVILAHSADYARAYYTARGRDVGRVVKGDYRVKAREAAAKASGGFKLDHAAVRDACDLLGLKLPVSIRFNGRVGNTNGNYSFDGRKHRIMLKSYRTPEQASSTLWHELCHAMQAERAGTMADWAVVRREEARYPYRSRPIEREAREMSATMADVPLTRAP